MVVLFSLFTLITILIFRRFLAYPALPNRFISFGIYIALYSLILILGKLILISIFPLCYVGVFVVHMVGDMGTPLYMIPPGDDLTGGASSGSKSEVDLELRLGGPGTEVGESSRQSSDFNLNLPPLPEGDVLIREANEIGEMRDKIERGELTPEEIPAFQQRKDRLLELLNEGRRVSKVLGKIRKREARNLDLENQALREQSAVLREQNQKLWEGIQKQKERLAGRPPYPGEEADE